MNEKCGFLVRIIISFCLIIGNLDFLYSQKLLATEKKNKLFIEILNLGIEDSGSENSNDIFAGVSDIVFDSSGNIIIIDIIMKNIRKFDHKGKLLLEYSEIGSGPGEIKGPMLIENINNQLYVYDIVNRKMIIFVNDFMFEKEFIVPYSLQDMIFTRGGDFYFASIIAEQSDITKNLPIHIFDQTGKKKKSFGKEMMFNVSNIKNSRDRIMVYDYYAGRISLHIWNNKLIASPVFDTHTFVYDLNGQFLYRFKNPDFKHKLLNYKISKKGVTYYLYETQSGPAYGLNDKFIIKSYQLSKEMDYLEHFVDIFDWQGKVIKSQVPINGLVMDVSSEGLVVTTSPHPYTKIWVYRLCLDKLENKKE